MLTDLIAENYQSLRRVKLRLGSLTVITGPSSSGKTALFRAAELVAFNARGKSFITRGASKCVVGIGCQDEWWAASITRGERGADVYRISAAETPEDEPKVWEYTKLGGKVPEEAAQVVNLTELNFAGQFDPPFLLRETASEVARVLGRLTNVTLIFRASQEAGRRRKALTSDLKSAEAEVERLRAEAQRFVTLQARIAAVQQAEQALAALQETQARAARLQASLGRLEAAQAVLGQTALPAEPPDLTELEGTWQRARDLQGLLAAVLQADQQAQMAAGEITSCDRQLAETEARIGRVLAEAGICPTCGQQIHA